MRTRIKRGPADNGTAEKEWGEVESYDIPKRNFGRRYGEKEEKPFKERADRPERSFGDRPRRAFGENRAFGERSERGDRPFGDRPKRAFGEKSSFGEKKSFGDRGNRPERTFGERPKKSFGEKRTYGERGERSFSDRPKRAFGERGDRSFSDRPKKSFGEKRAFGEKKSFGDRGDRPFGDKPRQSFGEKRSFSPKRSFAEGHERPYSKTPYTKKSYSTRTKGEAPIAKQPKSPNEMRLNKFIANSGICSRREADEYITAGLVTVNGKVITELGSKININDDIRFNGERLKGEKKVYIIMNKPKDFVTTTSDPHADKNVMDLINPELCPERIFPVGRLDKSTTGILLFTNDGELTETLTHPSYHRKKIYEITLDSNLKQADFDALLNGIELEDGPIFADALAYVGDTKDVIGLEIHSGRNRIVRRMFEHLGYGVKKLDRVYFAGLTKKNLRRGQWRFLTDSEVALLRLNND